MIPSFDCTVGQPGITFTASSGTYRLICVDPVTGDPSYGFMKMVNVSVSPLDPSTDPFHLSTADGLTISAAIVAVWAIAWAGRALYLALGHKDEN
jgi:hypothetical protein